MTDCMEAVCKIYEEHLKKLNPHLACIQYDISELFKFIDRLSDLCCLVLDKSVYVPKVRRRARKVGKSSLKEACFPAYNGRYSIGIG
jgi:hypothetical protein